MEVHWVISMYDHHDSFDQLLINWVIIRKRVDLGWAPKRLLLFITPRSQALFSGS